MHTEFGGTLSESGQLEPRREWQHIKMDLRDKVRDGETGTDSRTWSRRASEFAVRTPPPET